MLCVIVRGGVCVVVWWLVVGALSGVVVGGGWCWVVGCVVWCVLVWDGVVFRVGVMFCVVLCCCV